MTTPARSAVTLSVGMTIGHARRVVAAVWPYVVLRLYHGTSAFYKEGPPWAEDAYTQDDDILRNRNLSPERPSETILLHGAMTERVRRDQIHALFELEPRWEFSIEGLNRIAPSLARLDTLDEMQIYAERACAVFKTRFQRPPGPEDRFDGVTLPPG